MTNQNIRIQKPVRFLTCLLLAAAMLTVPVHGEAISSAMAAPARPSHAPRQLIPSGRAMGVRLSAGCLVVVSLSPVIIEDNASVTPAEKAGLSVGDRITHIAGKPVESINSLQDLLAKNGSKPLALRVVRGSQTLTLTLSPARSAADGLYKIGALLRDNMAGIGTMTFYDPHTRLFGALGHGINELKSDRLLPMGTGTAMDAEITGVRKGESGKPGELLGKLDEETGGTIYANTEFGVFGHLTGDELVPNGLLMDVAAPKQVSVGPATILSCVGGHEVRPYQIEILRVYPNATGPRSFMLRVTDPELIEQTGGIVQGMSGSPVIQDGRLVGAVTHVMVGDPLRGYGIFASRMIETAMDGQKAAA